MGFRNTSQFELLWKSENEAAKNLGKQKAAPDAAKKTQTLESKKN